ncbi:hypothetical protein PanWU01x14_355950 [Parasponia andersonii]|uniref:Uncharacterized protein n=1 Tax=Parasponia andersonii TaxID=3476 RepID=A0A2P5A940_PARAD|nr:hypothetical protein PanWU01x14_355950 [Parasponia andersonii]
MEGMASLGLGSMEYSHLGRWVNTSNWVILGPSSKPNKSPISASSPRPINTQLPSVSIPHIGMVVAQTERLKSSSPFKHITA